LAAHGIYDPLNPLYTRIELAPDAANDGHLEVHEVLALNLSNANLIVLSGSEAYIGQQSRGDEIIGLTQAFLYAGAPSVITSLWNVDDRATGGLMQSFYQYWQEDLTIAEALRQAQIEILSNDEWRSPYYWASFNLTGDYVGDESELLDVRKQVSVTNYSPS